MHHAPSVEIVSWPVFLAHHEVQWLALWQDLGALHDLSPMWTQAMVTGHALDPQTLHVIVARDLEQALVLVWPLQLKTQRKNGLTLPYIEPIQNVIGMYAEVLSRLSAERSAIIVMDALRRWRQTWHWLEIENLDGSSPTYTVWQSLAQSRRHATRVREGLRSPYLTHQGSLEDFLVQKSKKFRKKVRGLLRDVELDDNVRVEFYQQPEELAHYLNQALLIEARSWKHAEGSAITSRSWERDFYEELLTRLGPSGVLKGAIMFIGDQPVAHSLELLHGARVLGLKSTFDQSLSRLSPGNMLMIYLLSHYFDQGCLEYDFLGGDEDYKLEWSETVRPHLHLRLYNHTLVGRALALIERWRQPDASQSQTDVAEPATPALAIQP